MGPKLRIGGPTRNGYGVGAGVVLGVGALMLKWRLALVLGLGLWLKCILVWRLALGKVLE
jgi:hypothetical protein